MFPKIIHQTWKNNNIPKKWKLSNTQWKKLHPDYQYILWTDDDIRNYIKEKHPSFLKIHDDYKYSIQRADMIRYFILYDFGGIYCDLDLYPIENIEKHISSYDDAVDVLLVNSGNVKNCITNSFMVSKKKAPLWKEVHKKLKEKLPMYMIGKHLKVMCSTGPIMLSNVCKKNKDKYGLLLTEKFMAYSSNEDFTIIKENCVLVPLKGQSWNEWDSKVLNYINNNLTMVMNIVKNTKYKNKLRTSLADDATMKMESKINNASTLENVKTNLLNLKYINTEFDDNIITLSFSHKNYDGVKIICDVFNMSQNIVENQKINDFTLFVIAPLKSLTLLRKQLKLYFSKPALMNTSNKLNYSHVNVSLKKIKEKMNDCDCKHTTSFLFALHVYSYVMSTKVKKVKVSKCYYIPWIIGNNKFLKYVTMIYIPRENIFKSIYDQIVNDNISTLEAWGIYYWMNFYKLNVENSYFNNKILQGIQGIQDIQNKDKDNNIQNYGEDVVFSNLPMSLDVEYLKFVEKSYQKEMSYSSSFGLSNGEISISWVNNDVLKDFDKLYMNCLDSL
jgi:mannosyltransferase OCH1-like enzyme